MDGNPDVHVTETEAGDLANVFNTTADGNNTYTDSELVELLGFVENMDNAVMGDDRACPLRLGVLFARATCVHGPP